MYILGLGGSNHDFSACIVNKQGNVDIMIEDERITRKKNGIGLGVALSQGYSRKYCLNELGLDMSNISLIMSNDLINPAMLFRMNNPQMINHHLAHAASAFFCSPFEESAILIIDSVGSKQKINGTNFYESITYAYGENNRIKILEKNVGQNLADTDYIENSLGIFYSLITEIIGFKEFQEGKTMGLSAYGSDAVYHELKKYIRYIGNGKVSLSADHIWKILAWTEQVRTITDENERFDLMKNLAKAAQKILEEIVLCLCEHLFELTKCKNLCLAGGVALNSVANYKIYKKKIFDKIFIQPASGDNGTAIGAALYGYYEIMNNKRDLVI